MEFVLGILVGAGFVAAMWLLVAGDREQDIVDEDPTLNTRSDEP